MKKILTIIIISLFFFPLTAQASTKDIVTFSKCIDGDTIEVLKENKKMKVRLLAVDTPETKHPTKGEEPYGKEASLFTCEKIKNAEVIALEYDDNSDKVDKYNRTLAWVWVDDSLLEKELIEKGYAKTAYLYGDYKYTSLLQIEEQKAKINKLGMWGEQKETTISPIYLLIIFILLILFSIISPRFRKKMKRKIKAKAKKEVKKWL
ncbi:MAG: thermonuclease family protein [Bacilli bacterium]|nr:thermonuclease family protein [Bacilli bacterium]